MATFAEMLMDNKVDDTTVVEAADGSKFTMGQVREAWLSRQRELDRRESNQRKAQEELAGVFQKLQEEKNNLDLRESELSKVQSELSARREEEDPTAASIERMAKLEKRIEELGGAVERSHKNQIEMASIWLDEKYEAALSKYGKDLPPGLTKAQLLKYAQDNGIKTNGVIDLTAAASRLIEPKVREREIKDAEERGARRRDEELTMAAIGAPSGFGPRGSTVNQGSPEKFNSLDDAFAAAAKDPSMWTGVAVN